MRNNHRKTGINGAENPGKAKAENISLPNDTAPYLEELPQTNQIASQSLKRAMAAVDGIFPDNLESPAQQSAEDLAISNLSLEEKLEEELASNFHTSTSSLYMPDLHDSRKLEKVAQVVSNDCENLKTACDAPQEPGLIYLRKGRMEISKSDAQQSFRVNAGYHRIKGGILSILNGVFGMSANKITAMLLITLATVAGFYSYNNPDNPVQLALLSKISQFAEQQNATENTIASANFTNTANASTISLAPKPKPDNVTIQPAIPLPSQALPTVEEINKSAGKNENIEAVQVVSIVNTSEIDVTKTTTNNSELSQTYEDEAVNLSERFESDVRPAVSNQAREKTRPETTPQAQPRIKPVKTETIDLSNSVRQTALLKTQPVTNIRKRNIAGVEQVVRTANVGNALDNVQMKNLVSILGEGQCVSPALSSVLGDKKVSPVFVRDLLTNLENRC
ncbi:MAG: hypothetical protein L3J32_06855 [Rhizobiaceae bacterium]|nr:hypothetical protein [Rhizobiaceae bacterium]